MEASVEASLEASVEASVAQASYDKLKRANLSKLTADHCTKYVSAPLPNASIQASGHKGRLSPKTRMASGRHRLPAIAAARRTC